ncbi:DUF5011 domain-containing protein, partial [Candidatus Nomurabacteria bacterium]|nr:DUF5011 domain-containing protein [Candidatus Nomurabacteria bacterium]
IGGTGGGSSYGYFRANQSGGNYFSIQANTGGGGNQYLVLQPGGGNVGIGTTAPAQKLGITGTSVANGSAQTNISAFAGNGIRISGDGSSPGQDGIMYSGGHGAAGIAFRRGSGWDTYIDFYTNSSASSGSIVKRMTIQDGGGITFSAYGAGTLVTDSSGNITASSDERLKDTQGQFTKGLEAIRGLNPILYKWNTLSGMEMTDTYAGFSAQNVRDFIPEAVSTDSRGYYTLQDRPIMATAINAIKELDIKVQSLPTFENPTLAIKVAEFLRGIAESGTAIVDFVRTQRVQTQELCIGDSSDEVCVNKDQLRALLNGSSGGGGSTPIPEPSPEPTGDTTAPIITLVGDSVINLIVGDTYTELGATATDDTDATIEVVVSGTVDTATVGIYTITYTATDIANNISIIERTINVTELVP